MSKSRKSANDEVVEMFHNLRHAAEVAGNIQPKEDEADTHLAYVIGTIEEAADFLRDVDTGHGMIRELRDIIKQWRTKAEVAEARLVSANPFQWQPIETAPKDGCFVLGAFYDEREEEWDIDMICWSDYGNGRAEWEAHGGAASAHWSPSHWMPMPRPPATR